MRDLRILALPVLALLAGLVLAPGAAPAEATVMALPHGTRPVNVNIGFNSQIQQYNDPGAPPLTFNGNATFAISLKDEVAGAE